jgi:acyl-CoA thioesterase-1
MKIFRFGRPLRYGTWFRWVNAISFAVTFYLVFAATASADQWRILALGDSLTAGYGLAQGDGFTDQLQRALQGAGYDAVVINAGVSGDTTAGGLARLDWALADAPDIAIVELGANDALRGIDPASSRANLDAILEQLGERQVPALLAGMLAPRNLGADYVTAFDGMYPDLADAHQVPLYPFFLEGVATRPELNQADGMHPNAQGVAAIVDGILPEVTAMLDALAQEGT